MLYARFDATGQVVALGLEPLGNDWQPVAPSDPRVLAFQDLNLDRISRLASQSRDGSPLGASDAALARVLEDLIDLLVERSVIRFTDLPEAAQQKLMTRRSLRASMRELKLLDDDDDPYSDTMI